MQTILDWCLMHAGSAGKLDTIERKTYDWEVPVKFSKSWCNATLNQGLPHHFDAQYFLKKL